MTKHTSTEWERANRTALVGRVLDFLDNREVGWDAEGVALIDAVDPAGWDIIAEAMGRTRPFSDATKREIVGTIAARERFAAEVVDDPFAGLMGEAIR